MPPRNTAGRRWNLFEREFARWKYRSRHPWTSPGQGPRSNSSEQIASCWIQHDLQFGNFCQKKIRSPVLFLFHFTRRGVLCQLALNCKFFLRFFFFAGTAQRHRQVVMRGRIALLQAYSDFQRWYRLSIALYGDQAKTQAHVSVAKTRIQLRRSRKVRDGIVPL